MKINAFIVGVCLIFLSSISTAQNSISGVVRDQEDNKPVPYATVYVNGTSNGVITNEAGYFALKAIELPAQLVVSHLSYSPKAVNIETDDTTTLSLSLRKKKVVIKELEVDAENNRENNLRQFKNGFFGKDYWGKEAVILNDSVLSFYKESLRDSVEQHSGGFYTYTKVTRFEASASEPLLVDLPMLGYTLHIDLVYYYEVPGRTSAFSYNYYKPYENLGKRQSKKVAKNRRKAYYNSTQHFCRALFSNTLAQEGYGIYTIEFDRPGIMGHYVRSDITPNLEVISDTKVAIKGLDSTLFVIGYFYNFKGKPSSVKKLSEEYKFSKSSIRIFSDSCIITRNGILPESDIVFGGAIGRKRTGAYLPKYYKVESE